MNGVMGTTKTGTERVIAIPRQAQETLEWWRTVSGWTEPEDLVFAGKERDKPLHVEALTHFFPGALERAKIPVEGRNMVVHSLRHSYNAIMRAALPEEVLRWFTGHSTPEMTTLHDHPSLADCVRQLEGLAETCRVRMVTRDRSEGKMTARPGGSLKWMRRLSVYQALLALPGKNGASSLPLT